MYESARACTRKNKQNIIVVINHKLLNYSQFTIFDSINEFKIDLPPIYLKYIYIYMYIFLNKKNIMYSPIFLFKNSRSVLYHYIGVS